MFNFFIEYVSTFIRKLSHNRISQWFDNIRTNCVNNVKCFLKEDYVRFESEKVNSIAD